MNMNKKILNYDQSALDSQFNLRPRVPDFQECMDRRSRESQRVASSFPHEADVAYGRGDGARLDIFPVSASSQGVPVNIFIHGGYWHLMDKLDFRFLAEPFVSSGVAFANLNYSLAPRVGIGQIIRQVREAVLWIYRRAAEYGIDPGGIHVSGHSAGGHLAAMMALTDWPSLGPYPADLIKSCCLLSGIYDLEPIRLSYLNSVLGLDEAAVKEWSPCRQPLSAGKKVLIAVGELETEEYLRQSAEFAQKWQEAKSEVRMLDVKNRHHFNMLEEFANKESALTAFYLKQMDTGQR